MDDGLRRRPLAYVDDVAVPVLDDVARRHLTRVRRLGPDTPITLADGRGSWRSALLGDTELVDPGPIELEPEPAGPPSVVAFAPVKGDRPEWAVQKLTELGVDHIVVLETERSVVRWNPARWAKQEARLAATIRSAGEQCRRLRLPSLSGPSSVAELVAEHPDIRFAEPGGPHLAAEPTVSSVAVGPEGGWSPTELAGRPTVGLGPLVLRAETACLAVAVHLAGRAVDGK